MKGPVRIIVFFILGATALFVVFCIVLWPPFTSEEVELTGLSFQLSETAFYDDTGSRGEGRRIWVYEFPPAASQRLSARDYPLAQYPMWSALAFDGYKRMRWKLVKDANSEEVELLKSALGNDDYERWTYDDALAIDEARGFARKLADRDDTLISGWYTVVNDDMITNYFLYVLNLKDRILVKLSLLT